MTPVVLLAISHLGLVVLGGVLGYRLARPPRRRSSIELRIAGAVLQNRGRHRR